MISTQQNFYHVVLDPNFCSDANVQGTHYISSLSTTRIKLVLNSCCLNENFMISSIRIWEKSQELFLLFYTWDYTAKLPTQYLSENDVIWKIIEAGQ